MSHRALTFSLLASLALAAVGAGTWPAGSQVPFEAEGAVRAGLVSLSSGETGRGPIGVRDTSERQGASARGARLPKRFYASRRQAVRDALPPDGVAVFFSSPWRTRENDVRYPYRQDSNLQYLSGASDPASVLLLAPGGLEVDGETVREVLFVPPRTPESDRWLGPRLGPARAERVLGVEKVLSSERFADVLRQAVEERPLFHLPLPYGVEEDSELARQVAAFQNAARLVPTSGSPLAQRAADVMRTVDRPAAFQTFQQQFRQRLSPDAFESELLREAYRQFAGAASLEDWTRWRADHFETTLADGQLLERLLAQMREQKTPAEQRLVRRAAQITAEAQKAALRAVGPGAYEYQVVAAAEYAFAQRGAEAPAFPSLAGSGPNTDVLQYHDNGRQMQAGELVVVDVGAEVHGYAADVARTAPVDGSFSEEERALYDLVLRAQRAAIRAARPGNNFRDPHQVARRVLGEGLVELDLLDDADAVGQYFPHPTAHYLGRSVHDAGDGGPLMPGTVLAIEPGLYLPASDDLPKQWHHVGVRIEDVVLVTEDGPEVLSAGAPRDPEAVEALVRERRES